MLKHTLFLCILLFGNLKSMNAIEDDQRLKRIYDGTRKVAETFLQCSELQPYAQNMCRSATYSCRGRCEDSSGICSCDEMCYLLADCCFDFASACPEVSVSAVQKALAYGPIDSYCDEDNLRVVNSCPILYGPPISGIDSSNQTGSDAPKTILKRSVAVSENGTAANSLRRRGESEQEEAQLSETELVIDIRSGLQFANASTFLCNGGDLNDMESYSVYQRKHAPSSVDDATGYPGGKSAVRPCHAVQFITFSCPRLYLNQDSACIIFEPFFDPNLACMFLEVLDPQFLNNLFTHSSQMNELSENRTNLLLISDEKSEFEEGHMNVNCHLSKSEDPQVAFKSNSYSGILRPKPETPNAGNNTCKGGNCVEDTRNKACFPYTARITYGTSNLGNRCHFISFRNKILEIVADTMKYWRLSFEVDTPENSTVYSMYFILTKGDYTDPEAWMTEWGFWHRQESMMNDRFVLGLPVPDLVDLCIIYELRDTSCHQLFRVNQIQPNNNSDRHQNLDAKQSCEEEDIYRTLKEQWKLKNIQEKTLNTFGDLENIGRVMHIDPCLVFIQAFLVGKLL